MNKKKIGLIVGIILFVVLILVASRLYKNLSEGYKDESIDNSTNETNEKPDAPDFVILDADGNEVTVSDFYGKPVVLNCWASWCGPCRLEMPDFNEVYHEYKDEIHFLMVNMTTSDNESLETAKTFIEESEFDFPVYYDVNGDIAYKYGIYYLPTTYFINSEGKMMFYANTMLSNETLIQGVEMLLK